VADPGEVAYIMSVIKDSSYSSIISADNATIDNYYGNRARAW